MDCTGCSYTKSPKVCEACRKTFSVSDTPMLDRAMRETPPPVLPPPASRLPKGKAKGRHAPGVMNKTEAAYAITLEARRMAGEISWYKFEGITLKLAQDTRYTPDFFVMMPDGFLECHEVKGAKAIFQDDAKVKVKVAASMFPFAFMVVYPQPMKDGGGWKAEEL